ncbi:MAG: IS110 family transposase ISAzo28 [Steroidobacteraceae bacterium]|nr:IS110 family transposase ISAzo28 [Steroidobacteraceae bacterium]
MNVVYKRCAGLDVHKKTVVVCVRIPRKKGEVRTFSTTTKGLRELAQWLLDNDVTHAAMESTGIYWRPVYNILDGTGCELLLVNAHHIKQVPGRKTDVKDAEWIAELLQHGLLTSSYVPNRGQRELRDLVRYRRKQIQMRTSEVQRLQKTLEAANIKLASVISDVTGVSGIAILRAIIEGETDPAKLAALGNNRLRATKDELQEALEGLQGEHQRMLLRCQLRHIDFIDGELANLDAEISKRTNSFAEEVKSVDDVPGIGKRAAEDILAETGVDMERFPTDAHFTSWGKVCPGSNESAGKRKSGRTGKGNPWLRGALIEAAWAAVRKKDSFFSVLYRRLAMRRGKLRAIVAVARRILQTIYFMLKRKEPYREINTAELEQAGRDGIARRAVRRLNRLGFHVTLDPLTA